jgi:putative regulator of septum formation
MTETPDPNETPGSSPAPAGLPPAQMGYQAPPPSPDPMGYTPPGPMGYTPPPPPKRSNRSGLIILGVIGLIVVIAVAYVALNRDSLTGAADALQVGDCFDRPEETDSITEIQHRPCNTAHDAEVIHNFTSPEGPDAPYPVISGFDDFVLENCVPVFESYVGRDWETDTDLNIGWLAPTLSGWTGDDHDRGFTCYVFRLDDGKLYGSVKNVGASPLVTQSP